MIHFNSATATILRMERARELEHLKTNQGNAEWMANRGDTTSADMLLEQAARNRAVIADLTRLLAIVEPLSTPNPEPSRDPYNVARALAVATDIQQRTADVNLQLWNIAYDEVKAMLASGNDDAAQTRATLTALAHRLGLKYTEQRHSFDKTNGVTFNADGTIDGVKINLWQLRYDVTFCERHQAAIIDGICDGCENSVREDEPLQDWERELLATATDPTPASTAVAEQRAATDAADAEAEDEHLLADAAAETDTSGAATAYTSAQLDGRACERCGQEFTASQARVADGLDAHGRMRRHSKCPSRKPAVSARDAA